MHAFTKVALLAVVSSIGLYTPTMAAPPMGGQGRQFCADPANAQDPRCMPAAGNNNPGRGPGANGGNGGPPPPNGFDFSRRDRDAFHQRFHGFNFGFFPTPGFSITLGVHVPRSYSLKHVPRSIYRYYPQFRGYLFFVTRNGSIVIVSPRSYRIIAVL